jgi:hypothetical protein
MGAVFVFPLCEGYAHVIEAVSIIRCGFARQGFAKLLPTQAFEGIQDVSQSL